MQQIELYYGNDLFIVDFYKSGQIYEIHLISDSFKGGSYEVKETDLDENCIDFLKYEIKEHLRKLNQTYGD